MNRLYAFLFGYFWLPCDICGDGFGGHEWLPGHSLMVNWSEARGICYKLECKIEAERRNKGFMEDNPHPPCYIYL